MSKRGKSKKREIKRLFFAVDLPEATLASAGRIIEKFGVSPAHVRWVRIHNLHISIKFLGDVETGIIPDLIKKAGEAVCAFNAMRLTIEGMGLFPNLTKPRVLWFGVGGDTKEFARLESELTKSIEPLGFSLDERPYTPHLTIGRVKSESARGELIRLVHKNHEVTVGDAPVDAVCLYESRLSPGGSVYTKVESFQLSSKG